MSLYITIGDLDGDGDNKQFIIQVIMIMMFVLSRVIRYSAHVICSYLTLPDMYIYICMCDIHIHTDDIRDGEVNPQSRPCHTTPTNTII